MPLSADSMQTIPLKKSGSPVYNSLSGGGPPPGDLAFIHRTEVYTVSLGGTAIKGTGQIRPVAAAVPSLVRAHITSVNHAILDGSEHLFVSSTAGFQVFRGNPAQVIFNQPHSPEESSRRRKITTEPFCRGVAVCGGSAFFVGTESGKILGFDWNKGRPKAKKGDFGSHEGPIAALASAEPGSDCFAAADEDGRVSVIDAVSGKTLFSVEEKDDPCTTVKITSTGLVIAGFSTGHVRLYSVESGGIIAEICAHARAVTAIDINEKVGLFCSVSEDTFLNVWKLPRNAKSAELDLVLAAPVKDKSLFGVSILDDGSIATMPYDFEGIIIFKNN